MNLSINKDGDAPVYLQIKKQIQEKILSGELRAGQMLPPERKLADQLGINRSTVLKAYQELKADGLLGAHVGRGTVVLPQVFSSQKPVAEAVYPVQWDQLFNKSVLYANDRVIKDIMDITSRDQVISFAGGMPSPDVYPVREMMQIQGKMSSAAMLEQMHHSPVEGSYPLRESLSRHLRMRDIQASAKDIMILSGSQQGLDFAARSLISAGDLVVVEEPTYLGAMNTFRSAGARIMGIPVDRDGMRVEILEALLTRYKPKLIYTLPTFQNPSGTVMSLERRHQLLELSYRHQIPILEDDPYGELRYEGAFVPPVKALDSHGYVIYLSTFSKVLFMGMRVGWVAAPRQVIEKFSLLKQMSDLHVNTPAQLFFNEFLQQNLYSEHLKLVKKEYVLRRDIMMAELERYSYLNVNWSKPQGGYYLWCGLPEQVVQEKLLQSASKNGVAYVPGRPFYPSGEQDGNHIRLNFTYANPSQIKEGIGRLAKAVEEVLEESDQRPQQARYGTRPIV